MGVHVADKNLVIIGPSLSLLDFTSGLKIINRSSSDAGEIIGEE